jgi:signal transduction histidine kinase
MDRHEPRSELDLELSFFELGDEERALLADLGPVLEKHADQLVAAFYRHLLSYPETRTHLRDREATERLLELQRRYLLSLAGPRIDARYVEDRRRIGEMHERIGLEPRWYLGAYALYLSMLTPLVCELAGGDVVRAERTMVALQRLLLFDVQIAMERYIARREEDLERLNSQLADSGRRLAHDLQNAGSELRRTTERARAAEQLASLGTLVAGLAHEIGTPMGVIQGHARLLESAVTDEAARWRLKTIQDQIGRISRIIQSLLNMARPARGRRQPVALGPMVDGTLAFLTEKLARRAIRLEREDAEPGPIVTGDPERLQQLFLNLFLNAADAMPEGGTLRVVCGHDEDGQVEVRVADSGHGIPEDQVDRVFDPFFTTKEAGHGNGLGLAVVQGIVTDHHGEIEVARSGPDGTEFRLVFPPAATSRTP